MRHIQHPGPAQGPRLLAQPCSVEHADIRLPAGPSLLAALAEALQDAGADSAVLALAGGSFAPLAWVLPHTAPTPEHAVYFSPRHDSAGPAFLLQARVTLGRREGAPWLHCHAEWEAADGSRHIGHLLPEACSVATPIAARATWLRGAAFAVVPDEESRFSLFQPRVTAALETPAEPAWALRLAPNADVCTTLAGFCDERGIRQARLLGGVGSTVGACFDDGRVVGPHITECFIEQGRIEPDAAGRAQALVDIAMVDHHGGQHRGRLAAGANPVLVTFELVLQPA
ncbi:conserved hypothetical protein [Rubrivivax sp. A210]|uniref:hypothetical protein n=1 Tax=Rubrivivax sp. A210 TaxID=2772301 RepID=UPI001919ECA6|nr:hypothetical protein [Rubrivivax sp. A210]CAD5369717.1 conserved hypothetical protein [Rubrivivax sp. A210]